MDQKEQTSAAQNIFAEITAFKQKHYEEKKCIMQRLGWAITRDKDNIERQKREKDELYREFIAARSNTSVLVEAVKSDYYALLDGIRNLEKLLDDELTDAPEDMVLLALYEKITKFKNDTITNSVVGDMPVKDRISSQDAEIARLALLEAEFSYVEEHCNDPEALSVSFSGPGPNLRQRVLGLNLALKHRDDKISCLIGESAGKSMQIALMETELATLRKQFAQAEQISSETIRRLAKELEDIQHDYSESDDDQDTSAQGIQLDIDRYNEELSDLFNTISDQKNKALELEQRIRSMEKKVPKN